MCDKSLLMNVRNLFGLRISTATNLEILTNLCRDNKKIWKLFPVKALGNLFGIYLFADSVKILKSAVDAILESF